jgi:biopolymer transport protein ExbB
MMQKVFGVVVGCAAALVVSYVLVARTAFFGRGGPMLLPVFVCSFLAWGVAFAKFFQTAAWRQDVSVLLKSVFEGIDRQRIKEALEVTEKRATPVARVLRAGILKYDRRKEEIREALDDEYLRQVPVLESSMHSLETLVQTLPLLGLLGALAGMLKVLSVVEAKAARQVAVGFSDLLAGGWEVALCGFVALLFALPLFLAYRFLSARIDHEKELLEQAASVFLEDLIERRAGT